MVAVASGTAVGENVGARCAHPASNKLKPHNRIHPANLILTIPKIAAFPGRNAT